VWFSTSAAAKQSAKLVIGPPDCSQLPGPAPKNARPSSAPQEMAGYRGGGGFNGGYGGDGGDDGGLGGVGGGDGGGGSRGGDGGNGGSGGGEGGEGKAGGGGGEHAHTRRWWLSEGIWSQADATGPYTQRVPLPCTYGAPQRSHSLPQSSPAWASAQANPAWANAAVTRSGAVRLACMAASHSRPLEAHKASQELRAAPRVQMGAS
jgi:hypothetical protein